MRRDKASVILSLSLNWDWMRYWSIFYLQIQNFSSAPGQKSRGYILFWMMCGRIVMLSSTPGGYSPANESAGQSIGSLLRGWRLVWQLIWSAMCQRGERVHYFTQFQVQDEGVNNAEELKDCTLLCMYVCVCDNAFSLGENIQALLFCPLCHSIYVQYCAKVLHHVFYLWKIGPPIYWNM